MGATTHPTAARFVQAARNVVMDVQGTAVKVRYLIRVSDATYPRCSLFDGVLADPRTDVMLTGIRMPRTNAVIERRVQPRRRELLDRTLIWNHTHLPRALRQFE